MRHLLVTGGCGFIGSNFIRYLLEHRPDLCITNLDSLTYAGNPMNLADCRDHPRYRFVFGDICEGELLRALFRDRPIDAVIHFAAESHVDRSIDDPSVFIRTNVNGTAALLDAAVHAWSSDGESGRRRFVHVSTDEVFGSLGATGYFREETPYAPRSPYAASKAASDHLARAYYHTYGLPVVVTNCSNNYGPRQFPEKLIPLMIQHAISGRSLPVYGDGLNVRDWLFVTDHCRALLTVWEKAAAGAHYNIGGQCEKTNIEMVRTLCDLLDESMGVLPGGRSRRSLIRFVQDRPGHDRRYAIDAGKIQKELGWSPSVSFEEGMRATVRWYLEHPEWTRAVVDGSYRRGIGEAGTDVRIAGLSDRGQSP